MVTQTNSVENETLKKIQKGNKRYFPLNNLLRFKTNIKQIHDVVKIDKQSQCRTWRNIEGLRLIKENTKENTRTVLEFKKRGNNNVELKDLYNRRDTVDEIKRKRLEQAGNRKRW